MIFLRRLKTSKSQLSVTRTPDAVICREIPNARQDLTTCQKLPRGSDQMPASVVAGLM